MGDRYDQGRYHTFARSEKSTARQRVTDEVPKPGDWVVVVAAFDITLPDGRKAPLKGCEARVETVSGDEAVVALNGDHGLASAIGGSRATLPLSVIAPMVLPSFRPGDRVRACKGPYEGMEAVFQSSEKGNASVTLSKGETVVMPIEHIERIIANERHWA